jgi:7,8-dihydro-6-hydroxymethylpterin dimethyltransferase
MFSGGEPTIHPEILGFMKMAAEKGVKIVNLNTNACASRTTASS